MGKQAKIVCQTEWFREVNLVLNRFTGRVWRGGLSLREDTLEGSLERKYDKIKSRFALCCIEGKRFICLFVILFCVYMQHSTLGKEK